MSESFDPDQAYAIPPERIAGKSGHLLEAIPIRMADVMDEAQRLFSEHSFGVEADIMIAMYSVTLGAALDQIVKLTDEKS